MAGADNLIPIRDSVTARERGRAGGTKSGRSKRYKRSLKERLQALLECYKGDMEVADAIGLALIEKALAGDVRAFEVIRDTIGEKPIEKVQPVTESALRVVWGGEEVIEVEAVKK